MKPNWEALPVSQVTTKLSSGATPTGGESSYQKTGIPLIRSMNVRDGVFAWKELAYIDDRQAAKLENVCVEKNDVLLNITGASVARVCRVPESVLPARVNQHVMIVRAGRNLDSKFLEHQLLFRKPDLLKLAGSGATREAITKAAFEKVTLVLPPLEEQRRIADILDRAETLRAKRRAALAHLDELTRAFFLSTFGDPIRNSKGFGTKKLIELVDPSRGISYGIVQRGEDVDDGVPILRIGDIVDGSISGGKVKLVGSEIAGQYARTILRGGEVVISIRGSVGRCAVVPASFAGGNISRELALLPVVSGFSVDFLVDLLRCAPVQTRIAGGIKGVAQRGINLADLRELPIIQPSQADLVQYEAGKHRIKGLESHCQQSLAQLDTLFQSLQHRAFRGEL